VEEIIINSTGASSPKWFTEYGGSLYFSADGGSSGVELWRYGGSGSPVQVADIAAGAPGSNPSYLTVFDGRLYFAADDGSHGVELWSFDGFDAELVADIHPEGSSGPEYLTVYGEGLYFSADNGSIGKELWVVQ
jgi:ELWxxDGT repeat protein